MRSDENDNPTVPTVNEPLSQSGINISNPLYMHPYDNPGATLVPAPFDGFGYRSWRRSVMRALSVKNKLGFINGDCKRPDLDSPNFRLWERCDDMVTSWILNSLTKEIADSVEYVADAFELWRELEDRYDQTNGTKLYQIQKEINDLSQGSLDITSYYTKMKKLWEELNTLIAKSHCTCNYSCGAKESMHKAEQDRRLIQFLMGLNETYTVVRESILMMNPLPSIAQAFSLLIQEERQREIKPTGHLVLESSTLNANKTKPNTFRTNYSPNNNHNNRNRPFCDYCKRPGHTKEKCYKLHGYPQNFGHNQNPNTGQNSFSQNTRQGSNYNYSYNSNNNSANRLNRGNRTIANAYVAATESQPAENDKYVSHDNPQNVSLTKEEYNQLVTLLQQFQSSGIGDHGGGTNATSGTTNFAGPFNEEASGDWLGHIPFVKMKRITSIPANFSPKQPFTCTICPMARQERLPFPQKTSGPYHISTHDKHKYFITIVDDYSRSTWTHLLSSKSNAIDILKNFMSLVENQFGINIKSIRSDNGLEFTSGEATKLFQSKGIIHQRTCPYTPQQNGVVERKHKYLLETARALLFQSKLPLRYWGECVLCATYIINRLSSNSINNKTPYELLYKRKPKYSHLKSFGCLCYPTVPIPHRDKFNPRTVPHVFVGYPFNTKGYKVLNLATIKIYISRDVVFNESIFPFNCSINKSSNSLVFYPVPFIASLDEHLPKNTGNMQTTENLSDQGNVDNTPISMSPIHAASPLSHGISSPSPHNTSSEHNIEQTKTEQIHPTRQQHIASDLLTPDSQALVRNVCHEREPSSYEEVAIDHAWQAAMTQELDALHSNHTWDLVMLPPRKQAIGC
uniref:Uncharacterized protein LOC104241936 n=1 Tax=Nicotiana sylvestris TaxID=4096 RepID=A0A1U7XT15_NICSY|nr:PREDICTED: uncharacterized protein LOC104241936 [Nicotiana sylvestris]